MSNTEPQLEVIPKSPAEVAKALVYIALSAAGVLQLANSDNLISLPEALLIAVAVIGAIGVYFLRGTAAKTGVTFAVAALQAVITVLGDSANSFATVSLNNWILVGVTAFAAIGVAITPNKQQPAEFTSVTPTFTDADPTPAEPSSSSSL